MRGFCAAIVTSGVLMVFAALASPVLAADSPPPVPTNEWPDPNFYIQDASGTTAAMNDALTGAIPPVAVGGYSTGSRDVTVRVESTAGLVVGQYVSFAAPCDPALRATFLQIKSIAPGRSFDVTLEYPSGIPAATGACMATVVQHGDVTGRVGGGNITSNVHRYADGKVFPNFWISSRPAHTGRLDAGVNVLVVRKVTDGPETIYWAATTTSLVAGTSRGFGAAVVVAGGAGASARAFVNTGAVMIGAAVATGRTRTWVAVHIAVPSAAPIYQEGVLLSGPVGSTFVLGEFESVPYPADPPDHSFSTPARQTVMSLASISPWVGARFTVPKDGGFDLNMGQASNLAISGGVTMMIGNLEGECATFPAVLSGASPSSPRTFGPVLHQVLDSTGHAGDPQYYAFASGDWPIRDDHLLLYGTPGTTWNFLSWDIQGFVLLAGP